MKKMHHQVYFRASKEGAKSPCVSLEASASVGQMSMLQQPTPGSTEGTYIAANMRDKL